MKKIFSLLLCLTIQTAVLQARTGTAVSSSNWNSSSSWLIGGSNSTPTCGDTVTIPSGITITINNQQNYSACGQGLFIYVSGTLQLTNGNKLTLPFNSCVNILSGGLLKKSTPGGGTSTAIVINGDTLWTAGMGPQSGPVSFCETALPIELLRFEAKAQSEKVDLMWTTASEVNNDVFIIERSADGKEFQEIFKTKGAGNSTIVNDYETSDFYPLPGVSYYRLKQIDFDGKFSYSDIIGAYVKAKTPFDFIAVETTINSTIKLTFTNRSNEVCNLQVLELSGTPVFNMDLTVNAGMNKKEIYCPFLKKGIYVLSISNDEQVLSRKISFID